MTTANQMMRVAEQTAVAQQLHETACKTIPGRTVIVAAEVDGSGDVKIVSIPGLVRGEGGTADILAAALRDVGGYRVVKLPIVPVELQGLDTDAQAMYFRVLARLGLAAPRKEGHE
jgi:hypothetical protein